MHLVKVAMGHVVTAGLGMETLHAPLHRGLVEDIFRWSMRVDRKHDAPDPAFVVAGDFEQGAPFVRVGNVVGQRIAMRLEIVSRAQHKETLLVGEA